jgi:hypothetical protein
MPSIVDPAWILTLMVSREPASPYRDTFGATAEAIATTASREPLPGFSENETAALIASVAWFESRFQPNAEGDCTDAARRVSVDCRRPGAIPRSFCAMQIHETNLAGYGTSRAEILGSIDRCIVIGLRIMRESFRVCARRARGERLAWYAAGGGECSRKEDAIRKSKHRIALGDYFARLPRPAPTPPQERVSESTKPESRPDRSETF